MDTILWFRNDLRLTDHVALREALDCGDPVLPVFIWSPEEEGVWAPGAASCWWLHQSLKALDASLRKVGSRLVIRRGPVPDALGHLARERGAKRVYFSRRYEPASRRQETAVRKALATDGVDVRDFGGALLYVRRSSLTRVRTTRLTGVGHPTVDSPSRFESA